MSTHWIRRMGGVKRNPSTTADGLRVAPPILLALAISVFAGCANISSKNEPPSDVQAAWEGAPEGVALELAESTSAWWLGFNDPILNELMKTAETRNLDLRIEEARIREARALRQAAGANFRPDVSVFAEGVRQRPGGASASPFNTFELGLDASWELDVFGRVRNQARAAEADVQAAQADRDGVRVALLAEVARTYVEYRLYQAQTDIAQRTAAAEEGTVRITRARFEQGMSNRMELERTVSALAVTRAQIPQARTLADSARYRLAYLLASTPETLSIALSAEKPMPDSDPLRVLLAPTDVLALRPDVRAAQQRLVSAGQLREAAAALRYPRITLAGLLGVESGEVSDLLKSGSRTWSVGAGLLAPLFDFGRIRAAIDVADAQQEQAYLSYERTIRTALQETQTAIVSYTQGVVRQKEWAQAVQSSRIAANLARRQYMEGTLSLLEVLDAERSLYVAELGWAQATADVSIRLVTVYKTMGIAPAMTPS